MSSRSSGVYKIVNLISGKCYVGSAVNLKSRERDHFRDLTAGKHTNQKLQRAWSKYGASAFTFVVIERLQSNALIEREQHWMDVLNAVRGGYNISPVAGSQLGFRHTEDARRRMSISQTGKKRAPEAVEKTASALRGRPKTPEHIANASAARKGWKMSPEQIARLVAAAKLRPPRKPHSEETRAKIGAALRGKTRKNTGWTDERRAAMSARMTGRKMPPEAIEKTRSAHVGAVRSEATRARISAAQKARPQASEQTRQKLSIAGKRPCSEETKAKISSKNKGRRPPPMSDEARAAQSQRMLGRVWTEDEIARRVASRKASSQSFQR